MIKHIKNEWTTFKCIYVVYTLSFYTKYDLYKKSRTNYIWFSTNCNLYKKLQYGFYDTKSIATIEFLFNENIINIIYKTQKNIYMIHACMPINSDSDSTTEIGPMQK